MEETGYFPKSIKRVTSFYTSPGFSNEVIHLFIAKELKKESMKADFDEYLQVVKMPAKEVLKKIHSGEIADGKTISGLLLTYSLIEGD